MFKPHKIADPNKLFFTADTHFGHANIMRYANRPFRQVADMDEELIRLWNEKVPADGVVYHLGDFSFGTHEQAAALVKRLNGSIRFVIGNHDRNFEGNHKDAGWLRGHMDLVTFYAEAKVQDAQANREEQFICMSHYPMLTWNKGHHGAWMLHGHEHNSLPEAEERRLDIGVDGPISGYAPVSYADVKAYMITRKYGFHH